MKLIKLEKNRCAFCQQLEAYLDSIGAEYTSINIEDNPDVAFKYMVMNTPVLILEDDKGNEVDRMIGYNPGRIAEVDELVSKLDGLK